MNWLQLVDRPDWMRQAACADMNSDLFFSQRGASTDEAKAACRACPVRAECLAYAMNTGERFGIWGGLSERERRQLRRDRRRAAPTNSRQTDAVRAADRERKRRARALARGAAVAEHYGISHDAASNRISTARKNGHTIPHDRKRATS